MDKALLGRLEKLEQRTAEHSDASQLSDAELLKIISDKLGHVPTLDAVMLMAIEDSDADEVRRE